MNAILTRNNALMFTRRTLCTVVIILAALGSNIASAAAPQLINYQALLKNNLGQPLDTTVEVVFTVYNHPTANNILWSETYPAMSIADGNLSVLLGSIATMPDSLFKGTDCYLGIKVGADPEITPRNRLASVPYAFRLESVDGAKAGDLSGALSIIVDETKALGDALFIKNQSGEVLFSVKIGASGAAEMSIFDPVDSKDGSRAVEPKITLNKDGIVVHGTTAADTNLYLLPNGNITGIGQISMGTDSASGAWSTVFGYNNSATGDSATVSGGFNNSAAGFTSVVAGGNNNSCASYNTVICGGTGNLNTANGSVICGGDGNVAEGGSMCVIGGGTQNWCASGNHAVVSGGDGNRADRDYATVSGGRENQVNDTAATISGGFGNLAGFPFTEGQGQYSTVGGGKFNRAGLTSVAPYSTIAGGYSNTAGLSNDASFSSIGGGDSNTVDGMYATIPGGRLNEATGDYSFAAGRLASAAHQGAFVWKDATTSALSSTTTNQFSARASGGVRFFTSTGDTTGVTMGAGASSWTSVSDKSVKKDFREINSDELLIKLSEIPISRWKYIAEESQADHIGPMSQDFYSAFGLGDDDKRISTIDADGVALAAIQALYNKVLELEDEVKKLKGQ